MSRRHDHRQEHLALLAQTLDEEVTDREREAFEGMRTSLESGHYMGPTPKQEAWVRKVLGVHKPTYTNDWSAGKVPRGAEVETPKALQNLPMRPPHRRHEVT